VLPVTCDWCRSSRPCAFIVSWRWSRRAPATTSNRLKLLLIAAIFQAMLGSANEPVPVDLEVRHAGPG